MFIAFGEKQAEIWAFKVPYILHLVPVLLPLEGLEDHRIISGGHSGRISIERTAAIKKR